MQLNELAELLEASSSNGLYTAVDTSGFAKREHFERILGNTDLFLYDLKHMDPEMHERLTNVPNQQILENLRKLARRQKHIIIRMPIIPGVNDGDENIIASGHFVSSLERVDRVDLLPYHEAGNGKLARLREAAEPTTYRAADRERLGEIASLLEEIGIKVKVGG